MKVERKKEQKKVKRGKEKNAYKLEVRDLKVIQKRKEIKVTKAVERVKRMKRI